MSEADGMSGRRRQEWSGKSREDGDALNVTEMH